MGRRLYNHCDLDHEESCDATASIRGDFLMTYDDAEVREMAEKRGFETMLVPMKNTHHAKKFELVIGRSLDWARRMLQPKTGYLPGLE